MMLDFNEAPRLQVVTSEDWERRVDRLRTALKASAHDLVRHVFPRARLTAHEARIGNVQGDAGESLSIALKGDEAGLWIDHATGESGDMIDLWRDSSAMGFKEAVEDLEKFCGLSSAPRFTSRVHAVGEQRKAVAAKEPKVAQPSLGSPSQVWTYLSPDGERTLAQVRRYDMPDGDKTYRPFLPSGAAGMPDPRPLYRLPDIRSAETVVFCEGEKCADALASLGIEATSAMGGANASLNKTDWSPLAGKTVILWPDNDDPGYAFMKRVEPLLEGLGCAVRYVSVPPNAPAKWDAADAVAEGIDILSMVSSEAVSEQPRDARRRIPILSRADMRDREPPEYLIDEVITEKSVMAIYGPSGSLKSFAAIDLGMAVAHGIPWQGKDVKQGAVVYVTGEGTAQIGHRLDAWDMANGTVGSDAPFHLIPVGVPVSDPTWVSNLIEDIEAAGISPVMIWLDTLARTFGAGDENSQKDMNAYVNGVDRLRDHFGAVVGIVHHTGKDSDRGLRGSSALYAAMDTVIKTDRKGNTLTLKNQQPHGKQKDGAEFDDIRLEARSVALGTLDRKGREVTSLVLFQSDGVAQEDGSEGQEEGHAAPYGRPQGSNQQAVMKALRQAKGEPLGLTRLLTMTKIEKSRFYEAVGKLVEKGLVQASGEEGNTKWSII